MGDDDDVRFEKGRGVCTLCNPDDRHQHGPRDVVLVRDGAVAVCLRCAQTLFEVWKDERARPRYVDVGPAYAGMSGNFAPSKKGAG